jgi:nucleotide-binding universal stress UspA family protein
MVQNVSTPVTHSRPKAEPQLGADLTIPRFRTVLACTDFSPLGQAAIESAVELGRGLGAEHIKLAHVVPLHSERIMEAMASRARHEILLEDQNLAMKILDSIDLPLTEAMVTREVRVGEPATTLALLAGEIGADLIVIGSHGRGPVARLILGSVAQELIRVAPCPVLVFYDSTRRVGWFEKVLAGVDLTELSASVLLNAVAMAKPFGGSVRAVSVFEGEYPLAYGVAYGRRTSFDDIAKERRSALAAVVERIPHDPIELAMEAVSDEQPSRGLLHYADEMHAGLIVVGSNGKHALQRLLLGSTSTKVVEKSTIPVLVVPRIGA